MLEKVKKLFKSYTFNICLVIGVTALVLYFTLKDNYQDVARTFATLNPLWLIGIIALAILYQCIIGWILNRLTRLSNPHYTLKQGIINAFVASFFHGVTPSASGGQFAQVYIFKKQGVNLTDSASILWMDFILYQSTMVGYVLLLIILRFTYFYSHFSSFFILVIFGFLVNSAIIVGLWCLVRFPKAYTWVSTKGIQIGAKLHIVKDKEKTLANLDSQLERFGTETVKLRKNRKVIIQCIAANVLRLTVYYIIPFFCALALDIKVNPGMIIDILCLSAYVSMINCFIPLPGASGGTEATFMLMFSTIFGKIKSSSIMLIWRSITYYLVLVLGGIVFLYAKSQPDIDMFTKKPMTEEQNR